MISVKYTYDDLALVLEYLSKHTHCAFVHIRQNEHRELEITSETKRGESATITIFPEDVQSFAKITTTYRLGDQI